MPVHRHLNHLCNKLFSYPIPKRETWIVSLLLIHNNFQIYLNDNAIIDLLHQYKDKHIIRHIGITTEKLDKETIEHINLHKAIIDTIQIPFSLEKQFYNPSVLTNYFSIFNQENKKTEEELKKISKEHTHGHFIVLMNSEKRS